MNRDDLRVIFDSSDTVDTPDWSSRPVSDAELAEIGYVKLTGIDVEAQRIAIDIVASHIANDDNVWEVALRLAEGMARVLAALDKGET